MPEAGLEDNPDSTISPPTEPASEEITNRYKAPSTQTTHASSLVQEYTNATLEFASTASNETLGACLVGLCAATYYVLGRLGLVLMGLVCGIALHASWEGNTGGSVNEDSMANEARRRREVGLDVVNRVLDWREDRGKVLSGVDVQHQVSIKSVERLDYSGFAPATRSALTQLTDAVIRDYVKWWYSPLLPTDQDFPSTCRQTLTAFVLSISSHLSRKRPADTFLDFATNSCSIVIVFLNELSAALRSSHPASTPPAQAVQTYLENNPQSSLANVLDLDQQQKKLRIVAEDILHSFLDPKANACVPVRTFLKEILARLVLEMTVESCSKPEWINGVIVSLLEGSEPELLNALDAGMGAASSPSGSSITVKDGEPGYGVAPPTQKSPPRSDKEAVGRDSMNIGRASKAEDALTLEAKRLNELIAEEDAKCLEQHRTSGTGNSSAVSLNSTEGIMTPTSSRSEREDEETPSISAPIYTPVVTSRNNELDAGGGKSQADVSKFTTTAFTSFDQIIPSLQPTALQENETQLRSSDTSPSTLFKAKISIFDDSMPGEKSTIRAKPTIDYMIQIEPASSHHPGWMISRVYSDFETLHEIIRRISVVSGVTGFTEQHATLPGWRNKTKSTLREELEKYIAEALSYRQLADSEGMKRFLEKERGFAQSSPSSNSKGGFPGIGFPNPATFETMGKGMLDVLSVAPRGAATGGKAVLGGVTGVFGTIGSLGQKKSVQDDGPNGINAVKKVGSTPTSSLPYGESTPSLGSMDSRHSHENVQYPQDLSQRVSAIEQQPGQRANRSSFERACSTPAANSDNIDSESPPSHLEMAENSLNLPPPPSDMPDDYGTAGSNNEKPNSRNRNGSGEIARDDGSSDPHPSFSNAVLAQPVPSEPLGTSRDASSQRLNASITEQETRVTVELMFAVINELYNLSSAWNIRRTLLAAAKTFLLRPGNPNLEAIRVLLQDTVIEANTSDAGIASHVVKIRESAMPTEDELKAWPAPMTGDEKEKLRQKARKLLVERGMPRALTSVMGAAASGEALGRVFDCLQVPAVSRGLIFGLTLQGLRALTQ